MVHQPHPELWLHFSYEKTSQQSKFRELLFQFVTLSIPSQRTRRDVVKAIAKAAQIPIESLCNELGQFVYPRGQVVFGFAGDELDKVIQNIVPQNDQDIEWWVSDRGLNMAVVPRRSSIRNPLEFLNSKDKGNHALLRTVDGTLKANVNLDTASRFGGVTKRAIQKAADKGALESSGKGVNRRIVTTSLLKYFPAEN